MLAIAELLFNSAIANMRRDYNMDFQAYNKIFICKDEIKSIDVEGAVIGYEFKIKYPSYRGTFLSCIEDLRFTIDDVEIPKDEIYFVLNNKQFLLDELKECFKEYWFVRDKAAVQVMKAGGICSGEHKVNAYMKHRIPYTGYFGQYLVLDSDVTEILVAN
jgi:hypothetical protein